MWMSKVEEEATADEMLSRLKLIQNDPTALYNMDKRPAKPGALTQCDSHSSRAVRLRLIRP